MDSPKKSEWTTSGWRRQAAIQHSQPLRTPSQLSLDSGKDTVMHKAVGDRPGKRGLSAREDRAVIQGWSGPSRWLIAFISSTALREPRSHS